MAPAKERYNWLVPDSVDFSICKWALSERTLKGFVQLSIADFS